MQGRERRSDVFRFGKPRAGVATETNAGESRVVTEPLTAHKMNLEEIEKEILAIKERNRKVEEDKAWELSMGRKIAIAILTYGTIVILFLAADIPRPFISALVPAAAFFLSTLSLPWFKTWWIEKHRHTK